MIWRWLMIIRSKGVFTFHTSVTMQHHKRGYKNSLPTKYPILNPYTDQFVPFTFFKTITGEDITEILLINYITGAETDLTSDSGFTDLKTVDEYDENFEEVLYEGDEIQTAISAGQYYLRLKCTATEIFYSNIFILENAIVGIE